MIRTTQIQVLFEIALNITQAKDVGHLFKNSLSLILKKLNCFAGVIYLFEEQKDSFFFRKEYSIPANTLTINVINEALFELNKFKSKKVKIYWNACHCPGKARMIAFMILFLSLILVLLSLPELMETLTIS